MQWWNFLNKEQENGKIRLHGQFCYMDLISFIFKFTVLLEVLGTFLGVRFAFLFFFQRLFILLLYSL